MNLTQRPGRTRSTELVIGRAIITASRDPRLRVPTGSATPHYLWDTRRTEAYTLRGGRWAALVIRVSWLGTLWLEVVPKQPHGL